VRFAGAVVAEMAGMMMAVVDHLELRRGERGDETGGDDVGESAAGRSVIAPI
jgi:hypothetical protein